MADNKEKVSREHVGMAVFVLFVIGPAFIKWQVGDVGFTGLFDVPFWAIVLETAVAGAVSSFLLFGHGGNKTVVSVLGGIHGSAFFTIMTWYIKARTTVWIIEPVVIALLLLLPVQFVWRKFSTTEPPQSKEEHE